MLIFCTACDHCMSQSKCASHRWLRFASSGYVSCLHSCLIGPARKSECGVHGCGPLRGVSYGPLFWQFQSLFRNLVQCLGTWTQRSARQRWEVIQNSLQGVRAVAKTAYQLLVRVGGILSGDQRTVVMLLQRDKHSANKGWFNPEDFIIQKVCCTGCISAFTACSIYSCRTASCHQTCHLVVRWHLCTCRCDQLLCCCLQRQWAKLSGNKDKVIGWPAHLFEQFLIVVRKDTVCRRPSFTPA